MFEDVGAGVGEGFGLPLPGRARVVGGQRLGLRIDHGGDRVEQGGVLEPALDRPTGLAPERGDGQLVDRWRGSFVGGRAVFVEGVDQRGAPGPQLRSACSCWPWRRVRPPRRPTPRGTGARRRGWPAPSRSPRRAAGSRRRRRTPRRWPGAGPGVGCRPTPFGGGPVRPPPPGGGPRTVPSRAGPPTRRPQTRSRVRRTHPAAPTRRPRPPSSRSNRRAMPSLRVSTDSHSAAVAPPSTAAVSASTASVRRRCAVATGAVGMTRFYSNTRSNKWPFGADQRPFAATAARPPRRSGTQRGGGPWSCGRSAVATRRAWSSPQPGTGRSPRARSTGTGSTWSSAPG